MLFYSTRLKLISSFIGVLQNIFLEMLKQWGLVYVTNFVGSLIIVLLFFPIMAFAPELLNWSSFLTRNLLPVTIGNIIGGVIFVGMGYWSAYLNPKAKA